MTSPQHIQMNTITSNVTLKLNHRVQTQPPFIDVFFKYTNIKYEYKVYLDSEGHELDLSLSSVLKKYKIWGQNKNKAFSLSSVHLSFWFLFDIFHTTTGRMRPATRQLHAAAHHINPVQVRAEVFEAGLLVSAGMCLCMEAEGSRDMWAIPVTKPERRDYLWHSHKVGQRCR